MDERMREYAALLVEQGVNLKRGQKLTIASPIEAAPLVRLVAEFAYARGCADIDVEWSDMALSRMWYMNASDAVIDETPKYTVDKRNALADEGAAHLYITGADPEGMSGAPAERIKRAQQSRGKALKHYYDMMDSGLFSWCVASYAGEAWAKKVFPSSSDPVAALWDAIYDICLVKGDGNASARWEAHSASMSTRVDALNGYAFTKLIYKNSLGTDVTVGLPKDHFWSGGSELTKDGVRFIANIPTEEIFTTPHRLMADGVVYASMPLELNGTIIEDIRFRFEKGRIVEATAKGADATEKLKNAITMDEGASYLGEVALVPSDSAISKRGVLFYNTLFDENASCHMAFGSAYPQVKGIEEMSDEERIEHGVNDSFTHVDFMLGTDDLSIIGVTATGEEIEVFREGRFTF